MPDPNHNTEHAIYEAAYFIWERKGRPQGRLRTIGLRASIETSRERRQRGDDPMEADEEKILAGRPDANMPAY